MARPKNPVPTYLLHQKSGQARTKVDGEYVYLGPYNSPERDRLRVLLPSDPANVYHDLDLVPPEQMTALGTARVVITNFHAFRLKETVEAPKLNKHLATGG